MSIEADKTQLKNALDSYAGKVRNSNHVVNLLLLVKQGHLIPALFPYTTLFRSPSWSSSTPSCPWRCSPWTPSSSRCRSEEHTSELQSRGHLVCRHLLEKKEGLKQIDHCVITHWHRDHEGGVPALATLIPIKNYY